MGRWDHVVRASVPRERAEPIAPLTAAQIDLSPGQPPSAPSAPSASAPTRDEVSAASTMSATTPAPIVEDLDNGDPAGEDPVGEKDADSEGDLNPSPEVPQGTFELSFQLRVESDRVEMIGSAQGADLDVRFRKIDRREEISRRVIEMVPTLSGLLGQISGVHERAFQMGAQVGANAVTGTPGVACDADLAGTPPVIAVLAHSLTSDQIDAIQGVLSPQQRAMLFELLRQSGREATWVSQESARGEAS